MENLNPFRLDGRIALVTGARRGIGAAMAMALAEAGADVIGVSAQLCDGDAIACAVRALGRAFHAYSVDLADRREVERFVRDVQGSHPSIDILINNAGSIHRQAALEHSYEAWDRVLAVNLDAPFLLAREFGRGMVDRGYGKILFTASLLSFQGGITVPGYAASKGAIAQLTKALANEWACHGLNVNAIAPGYIATDNTKALRSDPQRTEQILSRIPAGRWGRPADLAGATVFLVSDAARYVHGAVLPVDGGWLGR